MGQRLVITIQDCGEEICKIYYHWSAYSRSALMETRDVLNVLFDEENDIKDLRLRMIRFCECNGGGIDGGKDSDEWKYIQKVYPHEAFKSNYMIVFVALVITALLVFLRSKDFKVLAVVALVCILNLLVSPVTSALYSKISVL